MAEVLTAPLAVIQVNGIPIGKMRNIRVTETYRRGRVSGIGEIIASEVPALEFNGTLTCQFYEIDFASTGIPDAIKRIAPSIEEFVDNVLLQEDGVDVVIYRKVKDFVDPVTNLIKSVIRPHASIQGCFLDREGLDINEGQISGHDQDFTFLKPITFTP